MSCLQSIVISSLLLNGLMFCLAVQEPEAKLRGIYVDCTCSKTSSNCDDKFSSSVLVYKMLTPTAIPRSASFIDKSYSVSPLQLTFTPDSKMVVSTKVLQIPLIRASVWTPGDELVVKVTIGLDTTIGSTGDSDTMFMLSDGVFTHGFIVHDTSNYPTSSPCFGLEGKSGVTLLNERRSPHGVVVADKKVFAGRVEMTLHVADGWGSCYTAHDAGFTREMSFTNKLDPAKGLFFEIYKNAGIEKVGLKFLEFTVLKE